MKHVAYLSLLLFLSLSTAAQAAHCFCRFSADGTAVDKVSKSGFTQGLNGKKCQEYCKGQFDAGKEAAAKLGGKSCGEVTVSVDAAIGTAKYKNVAQGTVDLGPCRAPTPPPVNQYAVKFICGSPGPSAAPVVAPGNYFTAINVHNPDYTRTGFRTKVALALPGHPGKITPWFPASLGPDEAMEIDCPQIRAAVQAPGNDLLKGFAVIQTKSTDRTLDIVPVYTAGNAVHVFTLDVDHPSPKVVTPACEVLKIDLSSCQPQSWAVTTAGQPTPTPAQSASQGAWKGQCWMSAPSGSSATYRLSFCLCNSFEPRQASITLCARSDNQASFSLNGTEFGKTAFDSFKDSSCTSLSAPTGLLQAGENLLDIAVTNSGGPSGVSVSGTITVPGGACPAP